MVFEGDIPKRNDQRPLGIIEDKFFYDARNVLAIRFEHTCEFGSAKIRLYADIQMIAGSKSKVIWRTKTPQDTMVAVAALPDTFISDLFGKDAQVKVAKFAVDFVSQRYLCYRKRMATIASFPDCAILQDLYKSFSANIKLFPSTILFIAIAAASSQQSLSQTKTFYRASQRGALYLW